MVLYRKLTFDPGQAASTLESCHGCSFPKMHYLHFAVIDSLPCGSDNDTGCQISLLQGFKGGPSDLGTKVLQKYQKNHPYTPKAF